MSDAFEDRKKSFEAKYKMDQELQFKVEARRNKMLGEWLADEFGLGKASKKEYAASVIYADMEKPGIEDVIEKVMADIAEHRVSISEQDVRSKMEALEITAKEQIEGEYPEPLGPDHERVGD
ncbi:MAG: DUF1476 domain-containing protein [Rhodospirillales bacterium]|jgi:hypothetical protein|nr:DUF1476 domain-containing protein [Rhodospirillales bacterium]